LFIWKKISLYLTTITHTNNVRTFLFKREPFRDRFGPQNPDKKG